MPLICVSIGGIPLSRAIEIASRSELVEIRIDLLTAQTDYKDLLKAAKAAIVTFRPSSSEDEAEKQKRLQVLKEAIALGAKYVDIEIESDRSYLEDIRDFAHSMGCIVIISYHNFQATPELTELESIYDAAKRLGADIVKIATTIKSISDSQNLIFLLRERADSVVVGMGELGKLVRVTAPLFGSLFTFAAVDQDSCTAPGQLSVDQLSEIYSSLSRHGMVINHE